MVQLLEMAALIDQLKETHSSQLIDEQDMVVNLHQQLIQAEDDLANLEVASNHCHDALQPSGSIDCVFCSSLIFAVTLAVYYSL